VPRGPRVFLCVVDLDNRVNLNPDCPRAADHEPFPRGYLAASEYADLLMQTHTQHRCPGCGRWMIWKPIKPPEEEATMADPH
jgi:hypothetical protein